MDDAAKRAAEMAEAMARAQQKVADEARQKSLEAAREEEARYKQIIPIDLEVTISRYQGDKKTSSLPYALTVNTVYFQNVNDAPLTSLRMGGEVPLPTMSFTVDGKPMPGFPSWRSGACTKLWAPASTLVDACLTVADSRSGCRCRTTQSPRRRVSERDHRRQQACR